MPAIKCSRVQPRSASGSAQRRFGSRRARARAKTQALNFFAKNARPLSLRAGSLCASMPLFGGKDKAAKEKEKKAASSSTPAAEKKPAAEKNPAKSADGKSTAAKPPAKPEHPPAPTSAAPVAKAGSDAPAVATSKPAAPAVALKSPPKAETPATTDAAVAAETKPPEKESLRFLSSKVGPGVSLSEGGAVAAYDGSVGSWSAQIGDAWISKDVTTIALSCEELSEDTAIGIVGRNFFPSDWDAPLQKSGHAVVLRAGDGKVFHKGRNTSFFLKPLENGSRINVILDMQARPCREPVGDRRVRVKVGRHVPAEVSGAAEYIPFGVGMLAGVCGGRQIASLSVTKVLQNDKYCHWWHDFNRQSSRLISRLIHRPLRLSTLTIPERSNPAATRLQSFSRFRWIWSRDTTRIKPFRKSPSIGIATK